MEGRGSSSVWFNICRGVRRCSNLPPPPHGSTLRKEARDLQGDLGFAEGTMKRIELWNKLDGKLYAWGGVLLRWGGGLRRSANMGGVE